MTAGQTQAPANAANTKRQDAEIIGLVGLAHAISHFFQLVLPPLFPWLMRDFSLSFSDVGLLMTLIFAVSGIGQAAAGFLVDRFGPRAVLLLGLGLLGAAALILASARHPWMLALAAVVTGMGNAVFHPANYTLINRDISATRLGHAFSTHGLTGTLGWAAAPVSMFGIATAAGWRVAAVAAAVAAFAVMLVLFFHPVLHERQARRAQPSNARTNAGGSLLGFLALRDLWMCFAFFVFWTLAFSAVQNFAPALLNGMYAVPLAVATAAVTGFMLGSVAGTFAGGFLTSTAAADRIVALGLLLAALLALVLATGGVPPGVVLPLMVMMGFGAGIAGPSRDMLVRKAVLAGTGPAAYGRVYGFVYAGLDLGLALSPVLFGPLMDSARFSQLFLGVALALALAIVTALWVAFRVAAVSQLFGKSS